MAGRAVNVLLVRDKSLLKPLCRSLVLRNVVEVHSLYYGPKTSEGDLHRARELLNNPEKEKHFVKGEVSLYLQLGHRDTIKNAKAYKLLDRLIEDFSLDLMIKQIGKGYVLHHYEQKNAA